MTVRYYKGRFSEESHLFDRTETIVPRKNDFIFYEGEVYKVLYTLFDYESNECDVFMRLSVEEDY